MDPSTMRPRTHRGVEYLLSPSHPAAEAFPWLEEDELQALADDIGANGQKDEVVRLPDGRVIDGRNRELACRVAGVEPKYRTADLDEAGVVALVVSANIHRRSLTASQRSMIAAELANMRQGSRTDLQPSAPLPEVAEVSQADAAKQLNVSPRSVRSAKKVREKAPELVEPVKAGKLDVKTAERATKLPAAKRKKIAKSENPKQAAKQELDRAAPALKLHVAPITPTVPHEPPTSQNAPPSTPTASVPVPAHRLYVPVEEVTAKVTKRELVEDDLSGPARARLIQGLEAAKFIVTAITDAIDGLRSEKLNPLELPKRFAAIAEQLREVGVSFTELSALPIEDMSKAVLQKYTGAIHKKMSQEEEEKGITKLGAAANMVMLRKLLAT